MVDLLTSKEVLEDVRQLQNFWFQRREKFNQWYELLTMEDVLYKKGMESYVANEPRTFYNMAHYLMTAGDTRHSIPVMGDDPAELERQSKVERACHYMWRLIDESRQSGGNPTFVSELAFCLLILGWYSMMIEFDEETGLLDVQLWSPANTFPRYDGGEMIACAHSYQLDVMAAKRRAALRGWDYSPPYSRGTVSLDNYFYKCEKGKLFNMILIDSKPVIEWTERPNTKLLVSPVGGFPDRGSTRLTSDRAWVGLLGQSIFETNRKEFFQKNKWVTFQQQILRRTAEPMTQEHSQGTPKVRTDQIGKRGAHFHFNPGEGLEYIQPPPLPLEIQTNLAMIDKHLQKGSFSDTVYGLIERGMSGVAWSQLASASANQILHPYMTAKHFILSECDKFWLKKLKERGRVFEIRGKTVEKLESKEIPEKVDIHVDSDLATTKDMMERATIANMAREHLDDHTILDEIYQRADTQDIEERKKLDNMRNHPMTQQVELAASYYSHADYLEWRGDRRQAEIFRRAAQALEAQLGVPPPGAAKPEEATQAEAKRKAGAPEERARVSPSVNLRQNIEQGNVRPG